MYTWQQTATNAQITFDKQVHAANNRSQDPVGDKARDIENEEKKLDTHADNTGGRRVDGDAPAAPAQVVIDMPTSARRHLSIKELWLAEDVVHYVDGYWNLHI